MNSVPEGSASRLAKRLKALGIEDPDFIVLMEKTLCGVPEDRLSAEAMLEHPFFTKRLDPIYIEEKVDIPAPPAFDASLLYCSSGTVSSSF